MDTTPDTDQGPEWLPASVVARAVGLSPKTVKRHAAAGKTIGQRPVGERGSWLIRADSAEDYYGQTLTPGASLSDPEPATLALLDSYRERERELSDRLIEAATAAAVSEMTAAHLKERLVEVREETTRRVEELQAEVDRARRRWWRRNR